MGKNCFCRFHKSMRRLAYHHRPFPIWICNFIGHFIFILLVEIFRSYLEVTISSLCVEISSAPSKSATITWISMSKSVAMSISWHFDSFYLFLFPFCNNMIYIYVKVSKREQLCWTPLLYFIGCVNMVSSFIFVSLFSCLFPYIHTFVA